MTSSAQAVVLAGSAAEGSFNKQLGAAQAPMIAEASGIPSTFADLGDYPMPLYDADLRGHRGAARTTPASSRRC